MGKILVCLVFAVSAVAFAGCGSFQQDFNQRKYFSLEVEAIPHSGSAFENQPKGLLIRDLSISPEFARRFFVYKVGAGQYEQDYYNEFMIPPARMITNILGENCYEWGLFRPVTGNESSQIQFRLWGKVVDLYVDMEIPSKPCSVLSIRLILEYQNPASQNSDFFPVLSKHYTARVPVNSPKTSRQMVLAWSQGLQNILSEFYQGVKLSCN